MELLDEYNIGRRDCYRCSARVQFRSGGFGMSSTQNLFESLPEKPDRRAHPRSHAHKLAYVQIGADNGGVALNFSEGGLAIAAAEVLTSDYFPSIRFQLPRSDALIEASGQVSWMSASKKEAGIQFIDL